MKKKKKKILDKIPLRYFCYKESEYIIRSWVKLLFPIATATTYPNVCYLYIHLLVLPLQNHVSKRLAFMQLSDQPVDVTEVLSEHDLLVLGRQTVDVVT